VGGLGGTGELGLVAHGAGLGEQGGVGARRARESGRGCGAGEGGGGVEELLLLLLLLLLLRICRGRGGLGAATADAGEIAPVEDHARKVVGEHVLRVKVEQESGFNNQTYPKLWAAQLGAGHLQTRSSQNWNTDRSMTKCRWCAAYIQSPSRKLVRAFGGFVESV
jgi:hypothetical protein